ncbi:MAG: hypothetical protein ACKVT2_22810 [Saprospiraceae bacterium]
MKKLTAMLIAMRLLASACKDEKKMKAKYNIQMHIAVPFTSDCAGSSKHY